MLATWVRNVGKAEMSETQPARPDIVLDTLLEWYEVQDSYRPKLGFDRASPASTGFAISRQWLDDDEIGDEIDSAIRARRASEVEKCIDRLDARFRAAIQTEMRNRLSGASVFSSVRNAGTHDADFRAALALLKPMLAARGLLD